MTDIMFSRRNFLGRSVGRYIKAFSQIQEKEEKEETGSSVVNRLDNARSDSLENDLRGDDLYLELMRHGVDPSTLSEGQMRDVLRKKMEEVKP